MPPPMPPVPGAPRPAPAPASSAPAAGARPARPPPPRGASWCSGPPRAALILPVLNLPAPGFGLPLVGDIGGTGSRSGVRDGVAKPAPELGEWPVGAGPGGGGPTVAAGLRGVQLLGAVTGAPPAGPVPVGSTGWVAGAPMPG